MAPLIGRPKAVPPNDVEADETRIGDPRLEPGREYDAVGPVFPFSDRNAMLRQALYAAPLCVDQPDVGPIEGLQIVVMEARTFAEPAIPGLQRFRRRRILYDVVDSRAKDVHRPVVGDLGHIANLLRGPPPVCG